MGTTEVTDVRALLELLPFELCLLPAQGGLRLGVSFEQGSPALPVSVYEFRIPGNGLLARPALLAKRRDFAEGGALRATALLQTVAQDLGLSEGSHGLVAEYALSPAGQPVLRWLDLASSRSLEHG